MQLEIQELTKNYKNKQALRGITLNLVPGIYGILGPNGAGKSTLMNILTGNLSQSGGRILLDGEDVRAMGSSYYSRLGYCPQQQTFYPSFSAEQFLFYISSLQGLSRKKAMERIDWALDLFDLSDVRRKPIYSFSGGMKQRLLIAQSLIHDPDILILDEPTSGLDPQQRIAVRNLIGEIASKKIVLISTHVVQDVEYIARELILLSSGQVIRKATPQELLHDMEGKVWEIPVTADNLKDAQKLGTVCGIAQRPEGMIARILCNALQQWKGQSVSPNLEDVYLRYFGAMEGL